MANVSTSHSVGLATCFKIILAFVIFLPVFDLGFHLPKSFSPVNLLLTPLALIKQRVSIEQPSLLAGISSLTLLILGGLLTAYRWRLWKIKLIKKDSNPADTWGYLPNETFPDHYVFCTNYTSMKNLEKVKQEVTQEEVRRLFRSQAWRAHLRERGSDVANYIWQQRVEDVAGDNDDDDSEYDRVN